jgi:hypothetical protein
MNNKQQYEWNDINLNDVASIKIYAEDGDDTRIRVDLDDNWGWRISDVHILAGLAIIGRIDNKTLPRDIAESVYVKRDALIMDDNDKETLDYWTTGGNTRWRFNDGYVDTLIEDMTADIGRNWNDEPIINFLRTKSDDEQEQFCNLVSELIDYDRLKVKHEQLVRAYEILKIRFAEIDGVAVSKEDFKAFIIQVRLRRQMDQALSNPKDE